MAKDYNLPRLDLINLVPQELRNVASRSLLDNLFNRFLTKDEAVPFYGFVGRKPSGVEDKTPKIPQPTVERDINALVPVYSFKLGAETYSFTPHDIIRKMSVLGGSDDQENWLYSQGNNYAPPIDLDRFTNFFNYYWVAGALENPPSMPWNPELRPEYYTIQRPPIDDIDKLNVRVASTANIILTGSGYFDQTWEVTFTSPTTFTITATGPLTGITTAVQGPFTLGATPLAPPYTAIDQNFTFYNNTAIPLASRLTLLTFTIRREAVYDGVGAFVSYESFAAGDKFTITAPFISSVSNVVFVGSSGVKGKILNVNSRDIYQTVDGVVLKNGDRVLVKNNTAAENGIYTVRPGAWERAPDSAVGIQAVGDRVFVLQGTVNANRLYSATASGAGFTYNLVATNTVSNTNTWQEHNYWVHRDELGSYDTSKVFQATRPIIEFQAGLRLNQFIGTDGRPSDIGTSYQQVKHEFNQLPLFDLYRYDGTHARVASGLFYYVEDPTADIDVPLQRRVARVNNVSRDFLFEHGMLEQPNTLLFYKDRAGTLKTVWHPGYSAAQYVDQEFEGDGDGTLTVNLSGGTPFTAQQIWQLVADEDPSRFKVVGSKLKVLPETMEFVYVGVPYFNGHFNALITAGSTPFSPGDTFTFRVGNLETTRYVYRDANDQIYDLYGGAPADDEGIGSWQIPRMFYNNIEASSGEPISEGTLYSHFRGILANQLKTGVEDKAFGGSIKLWSEQVNLLSSLMMQRDNTPPSIVDFAQRQHESALNSIVDLFVKNARAYVTSNGAVDTNAELDAFVDMLLSMHAQTEQARKVLYDSTSPIPGFPATLPLLGVLPLSVPGAVFENELNTVLFRRHDGSLAPFYTNTVQFLDQLGPVGSTYPQDMAMLLNDVLLTIEQRLFDGISELHRTYFTEEEVKNAIQSNLGPQLERELASWAIGNGFDPTAPDYVPSDALTWNYRDAIVFAPVDTTEVPARWYNALQAHQRTVPGVLPTSRPDLEPWRLVGFPEDPGASWDVYRAPVTPDDLAAGGFIDGGTARLVIGGPGSSNTIRSGLPVIDGRTAAAGDVVLLANEMAPQFNGLWVVSTGLWVRSSVPLTAGTVVQITDGQEYEDSSWVFMNTPASPGVNPLQVELVRRWTDQMWDDIQAARPTLKLSVNTLRDQLLPPYVSSLLSYSVHALTNTIPSGVDQSYFFGEGSPVETVWLRTLEYRYSLARALFRQDPLAFLGHLWGFEWLEVDRVLYDAFEVAVPAKDSKLHGESISSVQRTAPISLTLATGPAPFTITITRDAFTSSRQQAWSIRAQDGMFIEYALEGVTYPTISAAGYTLTNLRIEDEGKPFRVGDKFTISANADGSGSLVTFEGASYRRYNGFAQLFAQSLREASIDTTQGYAIKAFREWDVNLGYRAAGLVSTDDLQVFSDRVEIPENSYELRFKRSPYAGDLWLQALRVTPVVIGASLPGSTGAPAATTDASDWVFRVEGYNGRYLGIEYYTLNTSGPFVTFNALNGATTTREFKQYTETSGIVNAQLPLTIRGLQNVVDFMFGYTRRLEDLGWSFEDQLNPNIDVVTGRVRNWQLEIEKLIDVVYKGIELGQGHILNPFIDRVWVTQQTGLLSPFYDSALFDVSADPGVFDTLGAKISTSDLLVLRQLNRSQISSVVPMFSVHAQVDEFEHLFVFSKYIEPSTESGLIYDPFSAARITSLKFNGRRQGTYTLRPELGGHYLVNGKVRMNMQASTDKVAQYYDADHVFEDNLSTRHALALLGFSPKEYMDSLDLTNRSQFNFWRGLIQMKGTNLSVDAFLNNDRFEDAKIDEFWAYKVAEYGDNRMRMFPELKLTVADTVQQFTKLQFDQTSGELTDFTQIQADDEARWFSIEDLNGETRFQAQLVGTYNKSTTAGEIITLPFIADVLEITGATQLNANTLVATGTNVSVRGFGPATPKFNPIKLLNYVDNQLVEEIPIWHPVIGQHTPVALESINIISTRDPARYNVSTQVVGNANFDPLRAWGSKELGRVWWDTTNLEYVPYYDEQIFPDLEARLNRWGTLTDFSTIDVVEWVESSVPPAEYDEQAAIDAGNADLDPMTRADGQVYGAKTYSRERSWGIRPIAWSRAGKPAEGAHIGGVIGSRGSFSADFDAALHLTEQGLAILDGRTFSDMGIIAGMRFGAFEDSIVALRARSENVISSFTKSIRTGVGAGSIGVAHTPEIGTASTLSAQVTIQVTEPTLVIGQLLFTRRENEVQIFDADGVPTGESDFQSFLRVRVPGTDFDEEVLVRAERGNTGAPTSATFDAQANQLILVDLPSFGLRLRLLVQATALGVRYDRVAELIVNTLNTKIWVYDAALYESVCDYEEIGDGYPASLSVLINDFTLVSPASGLLYDDADPAKGGLGWRAWEVPTQAQLNADSRYPNSEWYPMVGPLLPLDPTITQIQEAAEGASFLLNNGVTIQRYGTSWGEWTELETRKLRQVATSTGDLSFELGEAVSPDRLSVYVNGVAQLTGTFGLDGTTLTVFGVPSGHLVVAVVRPYSPTPEELEFDPEIEDDLLVQRQYKVDYQYVELPIRDAGGAIISTKYFFWVKNRSSVARRKKLSVKAIAQQLTTGPAQYMTFQNIQESSPSAGDWFYDAITVSGLSYVVTKDDTFKLRFTRNFTLRDDPNELDLKNVHAEWALIRPGQRVRIPEDLWNKLVNAACGQDPAGNPLPSPRRVSYDERNGRSTQFGFGPEQILAPSDLVKSTLQYTILNTTLIDDGGAVPVPDYMLFLDFNQSDQWFSTPENARATMTKIWNEGKVAQINELFFAVLNEIAAAQYEMTDLFKTSRLSAYSIKIVQNNPVEPTYE
jgi:hypothetical protein